MTDYCPHKQCQLVVAHGHGTDMKFEPRPNIANPDFVHVTETIGSDERCRVLCRCGWESLTWGGRSEMRELGDEHLTTMRVQHEGTKVYKSPPLALSALFKEHDRSRMSCADHDGPCCPSPTHCVGSAHLSQYEHWSEVVMERIVMVTGKDDRGRYPAIDRLVTKIGENLKAFAAEQPEGPTEHDVVYDTIIAWSREL